ncbi:hypothetical protein L7F22_020881 [Adiantum nelumboides]|nr:hypothetical protein [Adiantum nelumboides]
MFLCTVGYTVHSRKVLFLCTAQKNSSRGALPFASLKEQLKTNDVVVKDAYGDGRHVSIQVVSADFEGKTSVNRQRMVYKVIWEELQTTVHAVDNMLTWTPEEAAQERLQSSS